MLAVKQSLMEHPYLLGAIVLFGLLGGALLLAYHYETSDASKRKKLFDAGVGLLSVFGVLVAGATFMYIKGTAEHQIEHKVFLGAAVVLLLLGGALLLAYHYETSDASKRKKLFDAGSITLSLCAAMVAWGAFMYLKGPSFAALPSTNA